MLDATLDQLDMGILIIDTNGTIVFVNTLCEKYLGIKRDEALHQNMEDFMQSKFNHQPELPTVLSTKKELIKYEAPLGDRYYKAVMKPLIKNEEMIGAVGEIYDVTDHVLEQRKLRKSIRDMVINIVPVMPKLGVLPLQPFAGTTYYDEYTVLLEKSLISCLEIKIEYLVIDLTAITDTSEGCIAFLHRLRDSLQLVGIEVAFTGIRPNVASALANIEEGFRDVKVFAQLSQAVEWFRVIKV